mgnify:CR=1 FL=1
MRTYIEVRFRFRFRIRVSVRVWISAEPSPRHEAAPNVSCRLSFQSSDWNLSSRLCSPVEVTRPYLNIFQVMLGPICDFCIPLCLIARFNKDNDESTVLGLGPPYFRILPVRGLTRRPWSGCDRVLGSSRARSDGDPGHDVVRYL